MTTDSTDFRIEIRHCIRPSYAYTWEIYSVRMLKCIKRSYRSYPTRGVAMKAGRKALLRIVAPSLGPNGADHSEHSQAATSANRGRY
jgi:hypothetical protein